MRSQFRRPGGTSIAEDENSMLPWIAGAVGIGVLIVVIFMVRGGEDETPATGPDEGVAETDKEATGTTVDDTAPPTLPEPTATIDRAEVASELEADLQTKRLWSAVEVDPGNDAVMIIRSAYCGDDGLRDSISKLSGRMSSQGVTKLECYERHGSLVFEQNL